MIYQAIFKNWSTAFKPRLVFSWRLLPVCEKWIKDKTPIETVLRDLGLANFDPEFYKEYEHEVVQIFNKQTGKSLQLKTKRGLNAVLQFLKIAW